MSIYFGADLHLDHKNILSFCDRPYYSVESMTEQFLCDFEETVKPGDEVYLLGDIQFCNHTKHLDRLTGIHGVSVHLIIGNHDKKKVQRYEGWSSSDHYKVLKIDSTRVILSHFPIECWYGREYGTYHFHGHTHNNASHSLSFLPNRLDVGFDKTGKVLVDFEEAVGLMRKDMNYNRAVRTYTDE